MAQTAQNLLLPWLRQGLAAARTDAGQVQLQPRLNGRALPMLPVQLPGPGGVIGLDAGQILRMEPPPDSRGMETTRLAAIEFDHPALPWLFTPQATPALSTNAETRLMPWLALVVVRLQPGVALLPATTGPLPVLQIDSPALVQAELPDPSAAWAWAHAQVSMATSDLTQQDAIRSVLANQPEQTLARLICPRVLAPFKAYLACVVPIFESGRRAGLGLAGEPPDTMQLAWRSGPNAEAPAVLQLPVYHHWRFSTGEDTDFESLARRIQLCQLNGSAVGAQAVHIGTPGFQTGASEALQVLTGGALQPAGTAHSRWPDGDIDAVSWQNALGRLLQAGVTMVSTAGVNSAPLIGPPMHGAAHAGPDVTPAWLAELNLDPRLRIAAGLGVRLVQEHQEQWVAQAWAQQGELQRANQLLVLHQLVRWTVQQLHRRRIAPLATDRAAMLRLLAPVARQVRLEGNGERLSAALRAAQLPQAWMAASMVRLTAPRGALQRRFDRVWRQSQQAGLLQNLPRPLPLAQLLGPTRQPDVWRQASTSLGMVSIDAVRRLSGSVLGPMPEFKAFTEEAVRRVGPQKSFSLQAAPGMAAAKRILDPDEPPTPPNPREQEPTPSPSPLPARDSAAAAAFRQAVIAHLRRAGLAGVRPVPAQPSAVRQLASAALMASLQPSQWMNARLGALLRLEVGTSSVAAWSPKGQDAPPSRRGAAPAIPAALATALAQSAPEWLLPGLQHMPAESVALLQADRRFIAALMVGANHEMVRELLWQGFPLASPAVTMLDQFWPSGQASIKPIAGWGDHALGDGVTDAAAPLVMALRGSLIQRFPDALVYAVPALPNGRPNWEGAKFPDFHGRLGADLSYFGFTQLRVDKMLADGWYVVLQQQPTAARFGVDDPSAHQGTHLLPQGPNAAVVAKSLVQQPFRLAIHAQQLLGRPSVN